MAGDYIFEVNEEDFDEKVLNSTGVIVLDLWAEWCGPCLALAPTLERLAEGYEGKVKIAKLNVDKNQKIAAKYGVRSIPTLIFFKDGDKKDQTIGNVSYDIINDKVKGIV